MFDKHMCLDQSIHPLLQPLPFRESGLECAVHPCSMIIRSVRSLSNPWHPFEPMTFRKSGLKLHPCSMIIRSIRSSSNSWHLGLVLQYALHPCSKDVEWCDANFVMAIEDGLAALERWASRFCLQRCCVYVCVNCTYALCIIYNHQGLGLL